MMRRDLRLRKKVAEGHGSQEEPYNISDDDEAEPVNAQAQQETLTEEERYDQILREAGINPADTPPQEKAELVRILKVSSEAVVKNEKTMKVTRGRARQQQTASNPGSPNLRAERPKVNKPLVTKSVTKTDSKKKPKQEDDDDLDLESDTERSEVLTSSATSTPSKNTRYQTASSTSDNDKDDYEVVKVTPKATRAGRVLGNRAKGKDNSPEDKPKTKGKQQTKLQKHMEPAGTINLDSSGSDEDEIPKVSLSPEYGTNQDTRVKRAVKRPVTSATKNDRPKRQRKSPSDGPKKPVYRKIDINEPSDDENEETGSQREVPRGKGKKAAKADKKPFYTQISFDETSDDTDKGNQQEVAKSPGKMALEVKVSLRISQDAKVKVTEGSSTTYESAEDEVQGEGHSNEVVQGQGQSSEGQKSFKVIGNSEPFSGISVSPDLFGSQQIVDDDETQDIGGTDDDVLNLEPTDDETQAMEVDAGTADDEATGDEGLVHKAPGDKVPVNKVTMDKTAAGEALRDKAPADKVPEADDDETQEMMEGPDGPVPVPEPERGQTFPVPPASMVQAQGQLFDIWIEAAKKRAARDKVAMMLGNKATRTKATAMEDEEMVDDTPCPYCARTPPTEFSHYKPIINKTRLRQKRMDAAPYFAPPGVSLADHAKTILEYLRSYRVQLRDAQRKSRDKVPLGRGVQVGRHCPGTLFEKVRGKASKYCDFNFPDDEDDDGLPDLNVETIQSKAMGALSGTGAGRSTRKRAADRDWLPDEQNNDNDDEDDFLIASKSSRSARKATGETGKGRGRGTRRRQMETNTMSDYFTNDSGKPLRRKGRGGGKATHSVVAMETQQFEVLDIDEGSNDSTVPPGQPGQNAQHEVVSVTSEASHSRPSSTETTKDIINKTTTTQHHSRSNSPLPFKLTGEGTMAYNDDLSDEEVEAAFSMNKFRLDNKTGELVSGQVPRRSTTPTGKPVRVPEGEKGKDDDDDIHLFEDPELDKKRTHSPLPPGSRKLVQYKVTRGKNPGTMDTGVTRRGTRTKRVKSPFIDDEDDDMIPGTQQQQQGVNQEQDVDANDVPGAALGNAAAGSQKQNFGAYKVFISRPVMGSDKIVYFPLGQYQRVDEAVWDINTSAEARRPLRERISGRVPVPIAPMGVTTQTRGTTRHIVHPHIVQLAPKEDEEKVDCPLCSRPFGKSQIEQHAATCEGTPSPQGAGGDPGHAAEPVQAARRGRPTRQAAPAFAQGAPHKDANSDDEDGFITLNNNNTPAAWTVREGAPATRGADRLKDYKIPKLPHAATNTAAAPPKKEGPMGKCPICDKLQPLESIASHADACARRMEADEALQQEQPQRTRRAVNALPVYHPLRQTKGNTANVQYAMGANVFNPPDSSDDDFAANIPGTRRMRTQQPQAQNLMNSKNSDGDKPRVIPTISNFIPTLSCPGTSPPSTRTPALHPPPPTDACQSLTTSTRPRPTSSPAITAESDSGTGSESGEDTDTSLSSADDDVPLRTALTVPQEARQHRAALTARRQGPPRVTNSPVRTFRPISAMQGENLIDFRNQFRSAAAGTGGRGKRKRTGGKRKGRKKRKVNNNKGASNKGAQTAQPKTLKDAW